MLIQAILGYVELCVFMCLKIWSCLSSLLALLKIVKVKKSAKDIDRLGMQWRMALFFIIINSPKCVVSCVFMLDNSIEFMQMSSLP